MPGTYISPAETGLYYLQSRYYDPQWGRFLNADVYVSTGQGLLGNNMFVYCLNNPVRYYDAYGMAPKDVYYTVTSEDGTTIQVAREKKWVSRTDKRKGSDKRKKTGNRERNIGHKNGEEHSRTPKGNGKSLHRKSTYSHTGDMRIYTVTALSMGGVVIGLVFAYL